MGTSRRLVQDRRENQYRLTLRTESGKRGQNLLPCYRWLSSPIYCSNVYKRYSSPSQTDRLSLPSGVSWVACLVGGSALPTLYSSVLTRTRALFCSIEQSETMAANRFHCMNQTSLSLGRRTLGRLHYYIFLKLILKSSLVSAKILGLCMETD